MPLVYSLRKKALATLSVERMNFKFTARHRMTGLSTTKFKHYRFNPRKHSRVEKELVKYRSRPLKDLKSEKDGGMSFYHLFAVYPIDSF